MSDKKPAKWMMNAAEAIYTHCGEDDFTEDGVIAAIISQHAPPDDQAVRLLGRAREVAKGFWTVSRSETALKLFNDIDAYLRER